MRNRAAKLVVLVGFFRRFSGGIEAQWCGKNGNYALYGQIVINSVGRMDGNSPHGMDGHFSRTIRSQVFKLSEGAAAVEGPPLS